MEKREHQSCCGVESDVTKICPECSKPANTVPETTLKHLLKPTAASAVGSLEHFRFCKTPECDVVYFRGETILRQDDLTVSVGLKKGAVPATVCYCFGWTKEKIAKELKEYGKSSALEDIKVRMGDPGCSCETLNPSGRCCLGDVSKALKELENSILNY